MEVRKCDRCNKYVDKDDIPQIRGWGSERAMRIGTPLIRMDLCPECFDALKDFLNGDKTVPNRCIDCKYYDDREYYNRNEKEKAVSACGSCVNCQRNFIATDPYNEVPSWCPLKGESK